MRISTRGRLAVAVMIDFALHQRHWPISLKVLSRRHRVSLSLLEPIAADLRRHSLVEATRGPGGGYGLGRAADAITVADIVFAIDGVLEARPPGPVRRAQVDPQCVTHALWDGLRQSVVDFLQSESLQKLASTQSPWGFPPIEAPLQKTPLPVPAVVTRNAPNSVFDLARFHAC